MTKKIIFSAGGTGGHIFPAIHLMKHFFDKGYKSKLILLQFLLITSAIFEIVSIFSTWDAKTHFGQ